MFRCERGRADHQDGRVSCASCKATSAARVHTPVVLPMHDNPEPDGHVLSDVLPFRITLVCRSCRWCQSPSKLCDGADGQARERHGWVIAEHHRSTARAVATLPAQGEERQSIPVQVPASPRSRGMGSSASDASAPRLLCFIPGGVAPTPVWFISPCGGIE